MKIIRRKFHNLTRADVFRIIPLGDIHLGAGACDEKRLKAVIDRIADDPECYWIMMGDACDFINRSDPRFDPGTLASWIAVADFVDLAGRQKDKFLECIKPIASKCLAVVEGNHEKVIAKHYERNIYSDIVCGIKELSKTGKDRGLEQENLAIGYNGWLLLDFYRSKKESAKTQIKISLHHGFGGGKLAGGKALNMERWLWTHDCDIAIFGHCHIESVQTAGVETIVGNRVEVRKRIGCYSGTFLQSFNQDGPSTYSEVKGYFPLPLGGVEIILRPGARHFNERIRIATGLI